MQSKLLCKVANLVLGFVVHKPIFLCLYQERILGVFNVQGDPRAPLSNKGSQKRTRIKKDQGKYELETGPVWNPV